MCNEDPRFVPQDEVGAEYEAEANILFGTLMHSRIMANDRCMVDTVLVRDHRGDMCPTTTFPPLLGTISQQVMEVCHTTGLGTKDK